MENWGSGNSAQLRDQSKIRKAKLIARMLTTSQPELHDELCVCTWLPYTRQPRYTCRSSWLFYVVTIVCFGAFPYPLTHYDQFAIGHQDLWNGDLRLTYSSTSTHSHPECVSLQHEEKETYKTGEKKKRRKETISPDHKSFCWLFLFQWPSPSRTNHNKFFGSARWSTA